MLELDYNFLTGFSAQHQLMIGRTHDRYKQLYRKQAGGVELSSNELTELDRLATDLTSYSPDRHAVLSAESQNAPASAILSVQVNAQKVAAANLSGSAMLSLARDREALVGLMIKPAASLTVGEKHNLAHLKEKLIRFVGPLERVGRPDDFKVVEA